MAGIVGYGAHVPRHRIKVEEIAKVWGADAPSYKKGLMLREKSVPPPDMDTITLSVEATRRALIRAQNVDPKDIGAIYIGSESHPYAVKPSGTTVAEAIGATPDIHCADFEFACKAGSEAMFVAMSHVDAGHMDYALGIAADTSQGAPSDALEFSAAAGAAAFIMGKENLIAECVDTHSYMTDMPDFWRREHEFYPQHAGRFTGEEAYFATTKGASNALLKKSGMKPADFKYAIFHQPNGKFPQRVSRELGFTQEQIDPGWLAPRLGNTYSGASPIGLSATLDVSDPGDMIFMCSYGSGAGADSFIWKVTDRINEVRDLTVRTHKLLDENVTYIDYGTYAKFRHKIKKNY
ncbi:MAG: hydroxymethylglutaryl-CoA synthase [candidate division Zixibacteria bacterium]|nr:hydroxymethylglutaryl-CoA synthase [candidate division Zixibacteria bacterium]MDH3936338.1 hydroxymethylglutaryl-CoA synthase [candidate division Zixibacteria bacterium]